MKSPVVFGIVLILGGAVAARGQTVTTETLLNEMTDLAGLAEFPNPPFTCKQFSSYDRDSKSPADAKGWFANGDTGRFIRGEDRDGRREHVLAEMEGPGAVVRIWSADPKGTIRFYLDEAKTPAIECEMKDWLGGTYAGVPKPIAGEYSKGWNSYFPVAYSKHCKITSDQPGFYYHVNYRTYPKGTAVQTFTKADFEKLADDISGVAQALSLSEPGRNTAGNDAQQSHSFGGTVEPGESKKCTLDGPGVISRFSLPTLRAEDEAGGLRTTLIRMTFDDVVTVVAPIGDFFGSAPGRNVYASLPLGVSKDDGFVSHWQMPFAKSATVEIQNNGKEQIAFNASLLHGPYKWTDRSMHFHAKWRADWQVPTRPMIDWNYLTATGQGQFVGAAFNIANPVRHWWGEGDEKIYVDGETFPSHFGTGTEDYFGYAWCWPEKFTHAYHAQPRCDGPGNYGITCVNRYHVLDRIPFTKDFRFDMELWHWNDSCKVDMAVTAYWYARPGGTDKFPPVKVADLRAPVVAPYQPTFVKGAIEGETLKVIEKAGVVEPQSIDGCSGDRHMWWKSGQKVGDKLVLAVPVERAGRYKVLIRCLKAGDYGIMQMSINDAPAGGPIDFYNPGIKFSEEIDLGVFELPAGDARFGVAVSGANEKAVKSYMFGLDYLKLVAVP